MLKVGLTGNIGCGKSTVASMFRELGAYVFDADIIIRGFYEEKGEVYKKVVEAFGSAVLDQEGNIDRKKLAQIVFSDKEKLRVLEEITHNALYKRLDEEFKKLPQNAIAIVEASLLVEKGTYKNYDKLIVVYAPYQVCKERALKSGFSEEDFERRWKHQLPPEEKVKHAHFIIDNSDGLEHTKRQVIKVYEELLNLVR
ncbi:dephospho-CoA kinase [Hydrogenobacter hydrogenophilus]|uniref:Dephospho-CoA kinase n=1 Tax=Hydrogenobacter hydrogenophilus TaxID=35835 RepID=A0A285NQF3_9AQUI|nr:dephospho-CoA kinase [Hydrogenobacter hydrogenophilus]SNZ11173.1 dephospho-CoA kinase [Hydrogenobacter hydrogenophilus]